MRKRYSQRAFLEAEARYLAHRRNAWKCSFCGDTAYEYAESGKCYFCFTLEQENEAMAERDEYFECKRGHSRCTRCG